MKKIINKKLNLALCIYSGYIRGADRVGSFTQKVTALFYL